MKWKCFVLHTFWLSIDCIVFEDVQTYFNYTNCSTTYSAIFWIFAKKLTFEHQTAVLQWKSLAAAQIFWCNQNLQETLFYIKLSVSVCGFKNGGNFRSCHYCHQIFFGSESNHNWQCNFQVVLQSYNNIAIGMFISYEQQTIFRWPH